MSEEEKEAEESVVKFVYKTVGNYYGVEGDRTRHIIEREVDSGEAPEDFGRFVGDVVAEINGPRGPIREKLLFTIPADNVDSAFELFDVRANLAAQDFVRQLKEQHNQIVTAQPGQVPGIITP